MTQTYSLQGLTCGNCVAKVKAALEGVNGITSADVSLQPMQATVTMSAHVATPVLAKVVAAAGNFILSESATHAPQAHVGSEDAVLDAGSYKPIYLIFGYVAGTAMLTQLATGGFDLMTWMGHFMAGFFLVFSFFKMLDVRGFAEGYATYDVIAKRLPAYGLVYPFIELSLGVAYLVWPRSPVTNAVTFVVMGVSTIGVVQQVLKKSQFQCACLGTIFKLPLSKVTLVEDLLMVAMSGAMFLWSVVP